ncbi:hypothetical protein Tco_0422770 [Tanacetum coccineum]
MAPKRATRSTRATTTPAPTATTTTNVTNAQLQAMINEGVSAALAARDATRNGVDNHTSRTGVRVLMLLHCEFTYQDFMKCKPLYFKGTEGVVELTQWFERMETVFRISNCSVENQIKFSTCTLLAGALTWWNSHVMTVTHDVAYAMTWVDLRKKMTDKTNLNGRQYIVKDKQKQWKFETSSRKQSESTTTTNKRQKTPQGITAGFGVIRNNMGDLDPYAQNAITTMTVRVLQSATNATNLVTSPVTGHFKKECPRMKNNKGNHGNQVGNDRASTKAYVVGNAGANPDNVVAGLVGMIVEEGGKVYPWWNWGYGIKGRKMTRELCWGEKGRENLFGYNRQRFRVLPLLVPHGYKEYCKVGPCGDIGLGTWQFKSPRVISGVAPKVLVSYRNWTLAVLALGASLPSRISQPTTDVLSLKTHPVASVVGNHNNTFFLIWLRISCLHIFAKALKRCAGKKRQALLKVLKSHKHGLRKPSVQAQRRWQKSVERKVGMFTAVMVLNLKTDRSVSGHSQGGLCLILMQNVCERTGHWFDRAIVICFNVEEAQTIPIDPNKIKKRQSFYIAPYGLIAIVRGRVPLCGDTLSGQRRLCPVVSSFDTHLNGADVV